METFETSATVEEQGHVHVNGVPFAAGTEVEVTISPKIRSDEASKCVDDEPGSLESALRWEGNVLVHLGVGGMPSVGELRSQRLDRLGNGQSR